MKLSFKSIASSMLTAAAFAFLGAVNANGQTVLFTDDFDAPVSGFTRVLTPELTDGLFPTSLGDVFGVVNIDASFGLFDESDGGFPTDVQGIASAAKTDMFLGFNDTDNDDNVGGAVSVVWTFDISGATNLGLSFQMAAMGDFESAEVFTISASIDGGTPEVIATAAPDEDIVDFPYTLASGTVVNLDDPFQLSGPGLTATTLFNSFETFSFPISGSGSQLVLTLDAATNGGSEAFGIDNLQITSGGVVVSPTGDFDNDGDVDCDDIDLFAGNIGSSSATFDLDGSGTVDLLDVELHVQTLVVTDNGITGTELGDLNCDGAVDVLGDAFPLVASLGMSGTVYTQGDINISGNTDVLGDAFVLVANLGFSNE